MESLELAEYQAARIENNNFDSMSSNTVDIVREKSVALMTGIVEYLNHSLIYFSRNLSGECTSEIS
jgi:hypothetical protein